MSVVAVFSAVSCDRFAQRGLAALRQFVQPADRLQPHVVLHQRRRFLRDEMLEQRPERATSASGRFQFSVEKA